jgi:hypothetical protein
MLATSVESSPLPFDSLAETLAALPPGVLQYLPPLAGSLSFPAITILSQLLQHSRLLASVTTADTFPPLLPGSVNRSIGGFPLVPRIPSSAINTLTVGIAGCVGWGVHASVHAALYPPAPFSSRKRLDTQQSLSHYARISVVTLLTFAILSPSFRALSPSSYFAPGAFASKSLPASLDYATPAARWKLNSIFRSTGCHTCGYRPNPLSFKTSSLQGFNADHIPPISLVNYYNGKWYNKLLRRTISQRFYPQCKSCSSVQGASLIGNSAKMMSKRGADFRVLGEGLYGKLHLSKMRLHHLTSAVVLSACGSAGLGAAGERDEQVVVSDAWGNRVLGYYWLRDREKEVEALLSDGYRKLKSFVR